MPDTRRITMRKIKDVLRQKLDTKLSHERVAASLGISKGVVAKYVGAAAAADSRTGHRFNLQTAVGCARACPDGRARQGERTRRTSVRKDEQRRMARPAGCDRVHSALTLLVSSIVVKNASIHR